MGVAQALYDPKRCHCNKTNRLNYQSLFRIGARASRPDRRERRKSSLKTEIRALFLLLLLGVHPYRYFDSQKQWGLVINTLSGTRILHL